MRIPLQFDSHPLDEQLWMLKNTWCDTYQEADLGMTSPIEYEEDGTVFVEGKCKKCEAIVINEVGGRDA